MNITSALDSVLARVWETSLSATILIGLAVLTAACFGKWLPAWCRYGIWLLVLARLLVPVAPPAEFSVWNLRKDREEPVRVLQTNFEERALLPPSPLRYQPERQRRILPVVWAIGVLGFFAFAMVRHERLRRWLRRQPVSGDARVLSALERAKAAFGICRRADVICNDRFDVPAVFGGWRPRVLLPARWVADASDEELFMVLLHEMAHVKCRDGLLNWLCIAAGSLHWFNPAVWYALWRLRKEREVFCDALVLARVRPEERRSYGSTLIKLAAQVSDVSPPTSLVPILQHKPEIHRRIHMIAKYKPTPWMWSLGATLVILALAGLTFTRAADKKPTKPEPSSALQAVEEEVAKQEERVRQMQDKLNYLREEFQIVEPLDLNGASGQAEALRKLESRCIEATAELRRLTVLHKHLKSKTREELRQLRRSIGTAVPDAQFSQLVADHERAEQKLAELIETHAPEHPEVKRVTRVIAQMNKHIEDRIAGILEGLEARIAAEEAYVSALQEASENARKEPIERAIRNRPFYVLLEEFRVQQEALQHLRRRAIDERIERARPLRPESDPRSGTKAGKP